MSVLGAVKQRAKSLLPSARVFTLPLGIARGLRMYLDLQGGHLGIYLGLYEVELNRHLKRLCYPGARSFDIGGQMGYDALVLAKLSGSSVVTVEASPSWCERMTQNLDANPRLVSQVTVVSAYVDGVSEPPARVTIDELADRFFLPDFMKIDIEGGEKDALLGAERVLSGRRPGVLIETHTATLEEECLAILRRHGYRPRIVDQRRILPDHRPTEHNRWIVAEGRTSATTTWSSRAVLRRLGVTATATKRECIAAVRICSGPVAAARLGRDALLYRVLRLARLPGEDRTRTIRLGTGDEISYRLNRGDIQGIREVFFDEVYRPPFELHPRTIVDLGANIGLTSVYLARRFNPDVLVAVEPDAANAGLARLNLAQHGALVIEAAVGPQDGTAWFNPSRDSNLGSIGTGTEGVEVAVISMPTLLATHGLDTIDLLKLDIEGGEQALLSGDLGWLSRVGSIIVEFHPAVVDYRALVQRLEGCGFDYIPAGTAWPGSMDAFVRTETLASRQV